MKPLKNIVFLRPLEEEKKTRSGIVLPDTAQKEKPMIAIVVAAGPEATAVKEGYTVLFRKYGPDEVELEGQKLLVGEETDILAIL